MKGCMSQGVVRSLLSFYSILKSEKNASFPVLAVEETVL